MHVPKLRYNMLLVLALEDEGYEVGFQDGTVFIRSKGVDAQDVAVRLGIREGTLYRLLG